MCERNIDLLPLTCSPTGDLARNPGTCPAWESNRRPFALWEDTQPTEPHQPEPLCVSANHVCFTFSLKICFFKE